MNVLIIDDNENITEAIKDFFDLENISCNSINNGYDGLMEIKKQHYDLILLDIAIPEFTGFDILNELKKEQIKNNKIVIFTASVFPPEVLEEFRDIGVKEILKKPVSLDKLELLVKKYLQ